MEIDIYYGLSNGNLLNTSDDTNILSLLKVKISLFLGFIQNNLKINIDYSKKLKA